MRPALFVWLGNGAPSESINIITNVRCHCLNMIGKRFNKLDLFVGGLFSVIAILALIAFRAPDAVAFSSVLVIPYLLLYSAPTAFIYAFPFTLAWFALARVHRLLGAALGLIATWGVSNALPSWMNARIDTEDQMALLPNIEISAPIPVAGTIALVQEHDRDFTDVDIALACSFLCRQILYSGSAPSVIVARQPTSGLKARAYRWRIEQLGRPCELPRSARDHLFVQKAPIDSEWRVEGRALTGECLTGASANVSDADMMIEQRWIGAPPWEDEPGLSLNPPLTGNQIRLSRRLPSGKTETVARQTTAERRKLATPLQLTIAGSPNSGAYWEWLRVPTRKTDSPTPIDLWLSLETARLAGADAELLRGAIDRWLADPKLPSRRIWEDLQNQYFRMIEKQGDAAKDVGRVQAIMRDSRTEDVGFLWMVTAKFPDHAPQFLDEILDRIAALPHDDQRVSAFDRALNGIPSSLFSPTPPKLVALLENSQRRHRMPNGIVRLSDGGPASAPLLFRIARDAVDEDSNTALATISALCKLGPQIAPSYQRLERVVANNSGTSRQLQNRGFWLIAVTRIRLGRPTAEVDVTLPSNVSMPRWRENLRRDAAEGNCDVR